MTILDARVLNLKSKFFSVEFLPRFYVKSILGIVEFENCQFEDFEGSEI